MPPKIEFAFLAEYAMAPENQLSALSMIDHFKIQKFPETISFYIAGLMVVNGGHFYKAQFRIISKPSADIENIRCIKSVDGGYFDLKLLPRGVPAKIALAIQMSNVTFEQAGEYSAEIILDDVCLHTITFPVYHE